MGCKWGAQLAAGKKDLFVYFLSGETQHSEVHWRLPLLVGSDHWFGELIRAMKVLVLGLA